MVGGEMADGNYTGATWGYDGKNWASTGNRQLPKLTGITLVPYYYFQRTEHGDLRQISRAARHRRTHGKRRNQQEGIHLIQQWSGLEARRRPVATARLYAPTSTERRRLCRQALLSRNACGIGMAGNQPAASAGVAHRRQSGGDTRSQTRDKMGLPIYLCVRRIRQQRHGAEQHLERRREPSDIQTDSLE